MKVIGTPPVYIAVNIYDEHNADKNLVKLSLMED